MCIAIPWFLCLCRASSVAHSFIRSLSISFSYRCAMENGLLLWYIRRHTYRNELLYACPMHSAESFLSMRYMLSLVLVDVVVVSAMRLLLLLTIITRKFPSVWKLFSVCLVLKRDQKLANAAPNYDIFSAFFRHKIQPVYFSIAPPPEWRRRRRMWLGSVGVHFPVSVHVAHFGAKLLHISMKNTSMMGSLKRTLSYRLYT